MPLIPDALFVETYPTFLTGLADIRNLIISYYLWLTWSDYRKHTQFFLRITSQYVTSLVQLPLLRDLAELY